MNQVQNWHNSPESGFGGNGQKGSSWESCEFFKWENGEIKWEKCKNIGLLPHIAAAANAAANAAAAMAAGAAPDTAAPTAAPDPTVAAVPGPTPATIVPPTAAALRFAHTFDILQRLRIHMNDQEYDLLWYWLVR